jgi:hypothetical protein
MKKSLMVLFLSLFANILLYSQTIPYIEGKWNVSNGSSIDIRQIKPRPSTRYSRISWFESDKGFFYNARGEWNSRGYFEVDVQRKSRKNGCITYLFMVIKLASGNKTGTLEESAKDNKCDLRIGYKQRFTIEKQ